MARDSGGSSRLATLELPKKLSVSLGAGHPWVYRDHLQQSALPKRAGWVKVRAGGFQGYALYDPVSPIALRIYARDSAPDAAWFRARVEQALSLRLGYRAQDTTAFRLLNGEGDGVPGLVADVYDLLRRARHVRGGRGRVGVARDFAGGGGRAVAARHRRAHAAAQAGRRRRELERRAAAGRLRWRATARDRNARRGMRLIANLHEGQKTGLFLDHRENRAFVRSLSAGCRVLNLFSYTGAFSISAALGGALGVTSVDIAAEANAAARRNFQANDIDPGAHEFLSRDVFEFLESAKHHEPRFDLTICDPPSFANSRDQLYAALRAYTKVNALGIAATKHGGYYAAASCTAQVSPSAFRELLAEAAARAGVRFQIVHEAGQALDHPQSAGHPEGRYLKFVVGRVLDRV